MDPLLGRLRRREQHFISSTGGRLMRRGRYEILTCASNPNAQLVGTDPAGGAHDLGLWIGANGASTAPNLRQLYILAVASFNAGQRGRLVGFRQYLTIGVNIAVTATSGAAFYPLERPVETATWKFTDGNVLWGIRKMPPQARWLPNALNAESFAFVYSETPAQLFQAVNAPVVTPPYGGLFPGNVLEPTLGRMNDLRCRRWTKPCAVDVPFEGPCDIAFFASVQQTNPTTRTPTPTATSSANTFLTTEGATPEDSFLQNYGAVTYFRIAGSLIFEVEEQAPTGAPKTYRRPGDADRLTRDTTETGDNTMRRSAEDTSEYKAAWGAQSTVKRPQSPPGVSHALGALPKEDGSEAVIRRLAKTWRHGVPGRQAGDSRRHEAPKVPAGLGALPRAEVLHSEAVIRELAKKWRGEGANR
jgi:hypothetical protein